MSPDCPERLSLVIKKATPYLFFKGDANQAIELYERALGAKVEGLQRYGDMPEGVMPGGPLSSEHRNRVMHACLQIGEAILQVSDLPPDQPGSTGSRVEINLDFDDVDQMTRCFRALGETGRIKADLHDAFWGDKFGALVDEFGIEWMFTGRDKTGDQP